MKGVVGIMCTLDPSAVWYEREGLSYVQVHI